MAYIDDILNVNAYLRSKMHETALESRKLMQGAEARLEDYQSMNAQADRLMQQAEALAKGLGADISDILAREGDAPAEAESRWQSCAELLVEIPEGYDFAKEFDRLCEEAHAAGFVHVHIEELLTPEELESAQRFSDELDRRLQERLQLTARDVGILLIATFVRVLVHFALKVRFSLKEDAQLPDGSAQAPEGSAPSSGGEPAGAGRAVPEPHVDASAGVDLDAILRNAQVSAQVNPQAIPQVNTAMSAQAAPQGVLEGGELINALGRLMPKAVSFRSRGEILYDAIPFDLPDNEYFSRADIAGYHPLLGWLAGVINILTNTVTTTAGRSFIVRSEAARPQLGQKVSTVPQVLYPAMRDISIHKEELIAAVVREAGALKIGSAPPEVAARMVGHAMEMEEGCRHWMNRVSPLTQSIPAAASDLFQNSVATGFINQLIAAIHAVHYNPEADGDPEAYMVRTQKIITLSSALATIANSTGAFATMDPAKADWSGVIITAIQLFQSLPFTVEVKTRFYISEHQKLIDEQMAEIDRYFVVKPKHE